MRCRNCDWDNIPDAKNCVKCNISLMGTMGAGNNGHTPVPSPTDDKDKRDIGKTIIVKKSGAEAWDAPASDKREIVEPVNTGNDSCPFCKYPLTSDYDQCPNCHNELKVKKTDPPVVPKHGANIAGTINPYHETKGGNCSLRPIPRKNETQLQNINFSGDSIQLNRKNIEPDNNTITGKVQATLQLINGDWYLVDNSDQQTTFVRAGQPVKLHKGDIILMGDRKFIFDF